MSLVLRLGEAEVTKGCGGWGMREKGRSIPQSRALFSALSGIGLSTINVSLDKIKIQGSHS